jgi:hypothetical protein
MTIAFELMIFVAVFAVAVTLFGNLMASSDKQKRKLLASHESRRLAQQPWDTDKSNRRGNR